MRPNKYSKQIEKIVQKVWGLPSHKDLMIHDSLMLGSHLLASENDEEILASCERYIPEIIKVWESFKRDNDGSTKSNVSES